MRMSVRKITIYALIPLPFLPPGVHLGLANACFLLLLLHFPFYEVFLIDVGRVLLVALLRGMFLSMGFAMSAAGAVLSFAAMALSTTLLRKWLSPFGHSLLGSTFHAVGQIAAGCLYMSTWAIASYLPILLLLNCLSSALVGGLVTLLERNDYLQRYFRQFKKRDSEASES